MSETTPTPTPPMHSNWQVFVISMMIVLMFGATCAWAIWTKDASAQWLVPVLATVFGNATGFYLGSSSSSHTKDATIAAQAAKQ